MPINIKNETVSRRAHELAQITGKSITEAVGEAVEAQLALLDKRASRRGIAEKLREISIAFARDAPKEWREWDYNADLYDEYGLPK